MSKTVRLAFVGAFVLSLSACAPSYNSAGGGGQSMSGDPAHPVMSSTVQPVMGSATTPMINGVVVPEENGGGQ